MSWYTAISVVLLAGAGAGAWWVYRQPRHRACPACGGTGHLLYDQWGESVICSTCHGTGRVER